MKFKKSSFSHILLCDVLEHVEKDREFLGEIRALLAKDGHLYLSVPACQFLWSQADTDAGHFRRYNLSLLAGVLKKAGFEIVSRTYFFFPLVPPLFASRTLPWNQGKRQTRGAETYAADHQPQEGILQKILAVLLSIELRVLKLGIRIPMGTSCFAAARRIEKSE